MKRKAYAAAVLLFTPLAAVAFALMGAAVACLGMFKAAFDIWTGE